MCSEMCLLNLRDVRILDLIFGYFFSLYPLAFILKERVGQAGIEPVTNGL